MSFEILIERKRRVISFALPWVSQSLLEYWRGIEEKNLFLKKNYLIMNLNHHFHHNNNNNNNNITTNNNNNSSSSSSSTSLSFAILNSNTLAANVAANSNHLNSVESTDHPSSHQANLSSISSLSISSVASTTSANNMNTNNAFLANSYNTTANSGGHKNRSHSHHRDSSGSHHSEYHLMAADDSHLLNHYHNSNNNNNHHQHFFYDDSSSRPRSIYEGSTSLSILSFLVVAVLVVVYNCRHLVFYIHIYIFFLNVVLYKFVKCVVKLLLSTHFFHSHSNYFNVSLFYLFDDF